MWGDLGAAIDGAVRRRRRCAASSCAAPARRRSRPATTSASSRPSASNKAQAIEYGRVDARDGGGARRLPASAGRPDPRHLRGRRPRDRRAVRPAHLRRGQPLRRADQEPGARDGVPRDGAARAPRRPGRRARDPARGPHLRRGRGEGQGTRHARGGGRRRRSGGAGDRAAHRRRRAAGRALAQEVRAAPRRPARRSPRPSTTKCFDCFDTEDFREGYAAFLAKRKPEFRGR